jgi:hypothetical protein
MDCMDEMQLRQLMMGTAEAAFSETEAATMLACASACRPSLMSFVQI